VFVVGALGVGLVRKKRRDRATIARWEREEREEAEEVARRAAINAAIQTNPPPAPDARPINPSIPKIEHEGDWHTLH